MIVGQALAMDPSWNSFAKRLTKAIYMGGGVVRYTHTLTHDRFTPVCMAMGLYEGLGCVNFTTTEVTNTTFDILTTDSRTGRPIAYAGYSVMLFGDN